MGGGFLNALEILQLGLSIWLFFEHDNIRQFIGQDKECAPHPVRPQVKSLATLSKVGPHHSKVAFFPIDLTMRGI